MTGMNWIILHCSFDDDLDAVFCFQGLTDAIRHPKSKDEVYLVKK